MATPPERPASPSSSTRSDLIRSFTTSSDTSASERIAAARAAREQRRREREDSSALTDAMDGAEEAAGQAETATTSSLVPKLVGHSASDRSFSPSVPSTPSRSRSTASPHDSPAKTVSPSPSAPTEPNPTSAPSPASSIRQPSPPVPSVRSPSPSNVALAGGLMERLKAQRAAKAASEAKKAESVVSEASSQPSAESAKPTPPTSTAPSLSAVPVAPAASEPSTEPPALSPAESSPESTAHADVPVPAQDTHASDSRRTQTSTIYGRNGEEIDFDFHQLSDVPERTERESLSTWRDSFQQKPRPLSLSSTIPRTPSSPEQPRSTFPNRFSYTSSATSSAEDAAASFPRPPRSRQPLPSSWSNSSLGSDPITQLSRRSISPDKHVSATSQLLGRSGSVGSIFPSSSSGSSSVHPPSSRSESDVARQSSPTRRISPELARKAAKFEGGAVSAVLTPTPRPPPAQDERIPHAPKAAASERTTSIRTTSSTASSSPANPPQQPLQDVEDPLAEIDRRRTLRRQALEAFQRQIEQSEPSWTLGALPSRRDDEVAELSEATPSYQLEKPLPVPADRASTVDTRLARSVTLGLPILHEGYLLVPPIGNPLADPQEWPRRYCVLTRESLEFRPTDQNPHDRPTFFIAECARVDDDAPTLPNFVRPFAVVLKDGDRLLFAAETRADRVAWILALQQAIRPAAEQSQLPMHVVADSASSIRSLTPPGSFFSETRGTVRSWGRRRPQKATGLREMPVAAISSDRSDRSLPPLPPEKPSSPLPPLPPLPGHRRARSDLSRYSTPYDEPPFRPIPTRPSSFRSDKVPLRKTLSPASRSAPSVATAVELEALQRDVQTALERARDGKVGKSRRDDRYRDLQARLRAVQDKIGDSSSIKTVRAGQSLWEKLDRLVAANERLLQKQEELAKGDAEARARRLEQEEYELKARVDAHIQELLRNPLERQHPLPPLPDQYPETIIHDNASLTTRAAIHTTPSEKLEWARTLEQFKARPNNEADLTPKPAPSSVASLTTMRRERDAASRKLEGLPPLEPDPPRRNPASLLGEDVFARFGGKARSRDPFASSGVVRPASSEASTIRKATQPKQYAEQPALRPYSEWSGAGPAPSGVSWVGSATSKVEQTLWRLLDGFEQQNGALAHSQVQQDRIAQVVGELARWVAEDRSMREAQFSELARAVDGVAKHIADLPQHLLASLQAAEGLLPVPAATTSTDVEHPIVDHPFVAQEAAAAGEAAVSHEPNENAAPPTDAVAAVAPESVDKRPRFGVNPLSSFAQLDKQIATGAKEGGTVGKVKGPRLPAIRLWGAPEPVADRTGRWGRGAVAAKEAKDRAETDEALAEADASPNGPIVDALKKDEKLGAALQALAEGQGDEIDAGTISLAVFEILKTMRDISAKQAAQEAKEAEEKAKNQSLSLKEKAELEAKKAEIARLELETKNNAERTARINEMVAKLAEKSDKADALLREVAQNVKDGKKTTMDPALTDEVKRLLGGIRTGVDEHVKDFRGQLTSEVQRMFKEVGKLRDEKKTLQSEIAELMAFQAKHGGSMPKPPAAAVPSSPAPAPQPSTDPGPLEPPKPGMPSSGFFGPRPMK
ncbi:hypothetical protein OF846_004103 [Rhodotorula toruloides]|nr:hypothetical protein OF846_004103 [Rhodotorula toruloides]